jgi:hypothetical protein
LPSRRLISAWVVFPQQGFGGVGRTINTCGIHNRPFPVQSYRWFGHGQIGIMYNCFNANCPHNFVLPGNNNAESSTPVGWRSINIAC